jgi:predicted HTH transcriptional regulator
MNLEELNIILARGENTRTEFKEAMESLPGSLYQTVVSFLNREGGVIALGADDDGRVTGINLKGKGSSWAKKGVKLKSARINKINELQFIKLKKGSGCSLKDLK